MDDTHQAVLKASAIQKASGGAGGVYSLPILTQTDTIDPYAVNVASSFIIASADLMARTAGDVRLIAVTGDKSAQYFTYSSAPYDFVRDGCFTIQPNDHSTKTLSRNTPLTDNYYRVTRFVKDNGAFDMDKTEGSALIAPAILQSKDTSSGGCNAGFAGTALIFAIALLPIAQKRKNHSKNFVR